MSIKTLMYSCVLGISVFLTVSCQKEAARIMMKSELAPGPESDNENQRVSDRNILIEPGTRIGPVSLGETQEQVFKELHATASQAQKWDDGCGVTFNLPDSSNEVGKGNVFVRFKAGRVFQIESATTRFHTKEGITTYDRPDTVQKYYKSLQAYVLLRPIVRALGDRPLIFWIDKRSGIAFVFAYYPTEWRRYVYKVIVFAPNTDVCPEDQTSDSPDWRELPPYSLEPPDRRVQGSSSLRFNGLNHALSLARRGATRPDLSQCMVS